MRFYDRAKIHIRSGKGGDGCVSFLRARALPKGGPDGGDGGDGGDIIALCQAGLNTLADYHHRWIFRAGSGQAGAGRGRNGKQGAAIKLPMPPGTQIFHADSGDLLADLTHAGEEVVLLRGGKGGAGNRRFKSSVRQAPRFAGEGEQATSAELLLRLKLMADAGLVGLANAGKTSLLAALSSSKGKIAPYPFTTRHPELAVMEVPPHVSGTPPVLADLPGLAQGSAQGTGLGADFLSHLERCRLVLHVVDASQPDHAGALEQVRCELAAVNPALQRKAALVLLAKSDLAKKSEVEANLAQLAAQGLEAMAVSALSGEGLDVLRERLANL